MQSETRSLDYMHVAKPQGQLCPECGFRFIPTTTWQKFCCSVCRDAKWNRERQAETIDLFDVEPTMKERLQAFHEQNPHVLTELVRLAKQIKRKGHEQYSIAGLFEVLRFRYALKTTGSEFKLNNNFKPFYARLIMETEPDLEGFFELRKRKDVA